MTPIRQIASDLSYAVLLKRIEKGEIKTPYASVEKPEWQRQQPVKRLFDNEAEPVEDTAYLSLR